MAIYYLTYRLGDDLARKQRQYSLMRAVHEVQRRFWDRTECFVIIETAHSLSFLGERFREEIDPRQDLFLLQDVDTGAALVCGANSDPEILSLLPGCRRLD